MVLLMNSTKLNTTDSNGIKVIEIKEQQCFQHNVQINYNPYINTKVSTNFENCESISLEHKGKCPK